MDIFDAEGPWGEEPVPIENNSDSNGNRFTLHVQTKDIDKWGEMYTWAPFILVFLRSKDGTIWRCKRTGLFGNCWLRYLPEDKEYKVRGFSIFYRQNKIRWYGKDEVDIWMETRWMFQ